MTNYQIPQNTLLKYRYKMHSSKSNHTKLHDNITSVPAQGLFSEIVCPSELLLINKIDLALFSVMQYIF